MSFSVLGALVRLPYVIWAGAAEGVVTAGELWGALARVVPVGLAVGGGAWLGGQWVLAEAWALWMRVALPAGMGLGCGLMVMALDPAWRREGLWWWRRLSGWRLAAGAPKEGEE